MTPADKEIAARFMMSLLQLAFAWVVGTQVLFKRFRTMMATPREARFANTTAMVAVMLIVLDTALLWCPVTPETRFLASQLSFAAIVVHFVGTTVVGIYTALRNTRGPEAPRTR